MELLRQLESDMKLILLRSAMIAASRAKAVIIYPFETVAIVPRKCLTLRHFMEQDQDYEDEIRV